MTTVQATKEPRLRGVSPTPSKIPVRSQRPPLLPAGKPSTLYQENQDPKRLMQKPLESAGSRPKAISQTEKSVGTTQLRNPLEELRLSSGVQNVGPGPPPLTEAPGTIEFVADPAALATILSGEGVKSCRLGRQPSLAQRVLVRGSQRRILQRDQGARASAYLAPRTPNHQLAYARASCFSRLEGPGPRGQTLCPQRLKTLVSAPEGLTVLLGTPSTGQLALKEKNPPSGLSIHSSTRPSFLELRRVTGGSNRTSVNQTSGLPLETPTQPASSLPEGEHPEDRGGSLCLAQRVPLKGTHTKDSCDFHLMPSPAPVAQRIPGRVVPSSVTCPSPFGLAQHVPSPHPQAPASYSVLRRLALRPKTQFTPIPSISRVQQSQGQCMSDLSPATRPEPEELFLPWEQIAVQLFDQQSSVGLQEPPVASNVLPRNRTPNPQELKMQRISILQKLLRQEVEGLAEDKYVSLNGGSSLDMVELPPLLSRISGTLNTPEHNSGTSHLPELQHSELPKPCLPDKCGKPQPCPPTEPGVPDSCHGRESEISEPSPQQQPGIAEPCPLAEPQPLQHSSQGNAGLPEPHPRVEPETPEACPVEPRRPESTQQSHNNQCAPVPTSLISSQHPPCASHPVHSLQSLRHPPHQSGPNSLAPRTLALRQRLRACLTAIHCFHETRLDDECAFYTSRASPSGPTRVCTNPVATLLEWQDALSFIPVDSAASQGSPS